MKTVRNVAAGAALTAALVGGGLYLAMAAPDGAATSTTQSVSHQKGSHQANGITEQLLTGDTAARVEAAAKAANPGATVVRVETDAEGACLRGTYPEGRRDFSDRETGRLVQHHSYRSGQAALRGRPRYAKEGGRPWAQCIHHVVGARVARRPPQVYMMEPGVVRSSPVSSQVFRPERIIGQPP